jgi:hypothetical protein
LRRAQAFVNGKKKNKHKSTIDKESLTLALRDGREKKRAR